MRRIQNSRSGFTLPELLVALFLFSVITAIAGNFAVSALRSQRSSIAQERLVGELTYPMEYMSRHIRQTKKDLSSVCLSSSPDGQNFEVRDAGGTLRFLDRDGKCREFLLAGATLQERISQDSTEGEFGAAISLTSGSVSVDSLLFQIQGEGQGDAVQPRVTFSLEASTVGQKAESQNVIRLQSTVSQRRFDREE